MLTEVYRKAADHAAAPTHHVPFFTRQQGDRQQAACGAYVDRADVATPETVPTCPLCLEAIEVQGIISTS